MTTTPSHGLRRTTGLIKQWLDDILVRSYA